MSSFSDSLGFPEHLAEMAKLLNEEREKLKKSSVKGDRVNQLLKLAQSTERIGNQLRAWDKKLDAESEQLSDQERLEDMRHWLFSLPERLRRNFYSQCALDELSGTVVSRTRLTVE